MNSFGLIKKLANIFVALAVFLAPLEFAYAHASVSPSAHAVGKSMVHVMDDAADCGGDAFCADCVYCSPALSSRFLFELPLPGFYYHPFSGRDYSAHLNREERPPRYL